MCLSVLGSLSTIAIGYAIGEGIAIAWWRSALRGASVKELHSSWAFGASVIAIFTEYKLFNAIALASLMAKLSIVDSVLFQRATTTYMDISWQPKLAQIQIWAEDYFPVTGVMGFDNDTEFESNHGFASTLFNWRTNGPLPDSETIKGCDGVGCEFALSGPGFAFDCESSNIVDSFLKSAPGDSNSSAFTLFSADLSMQYPDELKNYSRLGLRMLYPPMSDNPESDITTCPTNFTLLQCELRPALVNYSVWYIQSSNVEESRLAKVLNAERDRPTEMTKEELRFPVSLSDSKLSIGAFCGSIAANVAGDEASSNEVGKCWSYEPGNRQSFGIEVIENRDIHETWVPGANASLLGIYHALRSRIDSELVVSYRDPRWYGSTSGTLASTYVAKTTDGSCNYYSSDALTYTVQDINSFMLWLATNRDAYGADLSDPKNYNTTGDQYFRDVYHWTNYNFAIAAIVCTVAVIICILPAYWGFWQLGRDVTLGPMEIAYAFQGPAFAWVRDTNGHVDTLVKAVGDTRVKYAEINDGTGPKLAFKMA